MRILIINGSLPHYDHGLNRVMSVIVRTLTELGMEFDEISLGFNQIPYYDGMRTHVMDDIVRRLRASSGVILSCTSQLFAPSAMMHTFLEYFECLEYKDALFEKHCLLATVSKTGGERSALEYMAKALQDLGGYESGRIGLQEVYTRSIDDGSEDAPEGSVRDIIEKVSEDFYRAVRQNRKYIVPMDKTVMLQQHTPPQQKQRSAAYQNHAQQSQPQQNQIYQNQVQQGQVQQSQAHQQAARPEVNLPPGNNMKETAGPLTLETFTERQEQDIKELTALFSEKYVQPPPQPYQPPLPSSPPMALSPPQASAPSQVPASVYPFPPAANATPQPRVKTVKQLTQSLPHYYQPQMASGLTAIIQLSITGAEAFDGYLTIVDSECEYTDGYHENPEITIIADSAIWHDVLKGKHTAQKAFMIGGLKVRGNFVLLTKFDTLFKL